eukprot:UN23832
MTSLGCMGIIFSIALFSHVREQIGRGLVRLMTFLKETFKVIMRMDFFCPGFFFPGQKTKFSHCPRIFIEKSEAKCCPGFLPYAIIKGFRPNCSYKHL